MKFEVKSIIRRYGEPTDTGHGHLHQIGRTGEVSAIRQWGLGKIVRRNCVA